MSDVAESVLTDIRAEFSRTLSEDARAMLASSMASALEEVAPRKPHHRAFVAWLESQHEKHISQSKITTLVRRLKEYDRKQFSPTEIAQLVSLDHASSARLPSLIGFSIMRVDAKYNEIYYTDILSQVLTDETVEFVKRTVTVGGIREDDGTVNWDGSVGCAVRNASRCVTDSFRDAPGEVACADLVGGNRSILMKAVRSATGSEVVAVVFCFAPLPRFFQDSEDSPNPVAKAFYAAVDVRATAVRAHLMARSVLIREERLATVMGEFSGNEAPLLHALVPEATQHSDIGAIAGFHLQINGDTRTVKHAMFCDQFLQRSVNFSEWLETRSRTLSQITCDIANDRLASIVVLSESPGPEHPRQDLSGALGTLITRLAQKFALAATDADCQSPDPNRALSKECVQAKLAADLAVALIDVAARRLAAVLSPRGSQPQEIDNQLRLILAVAEAELVLGRINADNVIKEIVRAGTNIEYMMPGVVAMIVRVRQIDPPGRHARVPYWKGRIWSRLIKANFLQSMLDLGNIIENDDLNSGDVSGSATLPPFGEIEYSCIDCHKGQRWFVLLGLPASPTSSISAAVESNMMTSLVRSLYPAVLRGSDVEPEIIRHASEMAGQLKNIIDAALYLMRDGEQLYAPSLAQAVLSREAEFSAADRKHLLSCVEGLGVAGGHLRALSRQVQLFSWVVDSRKATEERSSLRVDAMPESAMSVVARGLLRGTLIALRRLDTQVFGEHPLLNNDWLHGVRRRIATDFALAEDRSWDWKAVLLDVSSELRQLSNISWELDGLADRECPADRSVLAETVVAELFQNALVASALSSEPSVACREEQNDGWAGIAVTNTAGDEDRKRVDQWRPGNRNDTNRPFGGLRRILNLCLICPEDEFQTKGPVTDEDGKVTFSVRWRV